LALTPYEQTRHFMGIREDVWVKWTEEIRDRAGKQVMMRGLFPARAYFGERSRPRRENAATRLLNQSSTIGDGAIR